MVVGVTLLAVPLSLLLPTGGSWAVLLYIVPILWSALEYGLRGGILAASGSGLFYLIGTAWMEAAGSAISFASLARARIPATMCSSSTRTISSTYFSMMG